MRPKDGFSVLELTIAMGIMLAVIASVFTVMNPALGSFAAQPEAADMQQRLRVASDTLYSGLVMAGAGPYAGGSIGPLINFFAPVYPYRSGAIDADPPATYKTDTITLLHVPSTASQTTITQTMQGTSPELKVDNASPNCPKNADGSSKDLCGLLEDDTVLVFDDFGHHGSYTITNVESAAGHLQMNHGDAGWSPPPGSKVVYATSATYYLKSDEAAGTFQLMRYSGGSNPDVPVVDHLVGLTFEYYGEPQPPRMRKPLSDPVGPWTTYGPKPPSVAIAPYAAGENCVFVNDGSPTPAPRLADLGAPGTTLVGLTPTELTDGPWCPDGTSTNRWDADLLRIRKVAVTLRVEAAIAALRGPASALFAHGGDSRSLARWVPDQEVRFQVSPRNLNLGR